MGPRTSSTAFSHCFSKPNSDASLRWTVLASLPMIATFHAPQLSDPRTPTRLEPWTLPCVPCVGVVFTYRTGLLALRVVVAKMSDRWRGALLLRTFAMIGLFEATLQSFLLYSLSIKTGPEDSRNTLLNDKESRPLVPF